MEQLLQIRAGLQILPHLLRAESTHSQNGNVDDPLGERMQMDQLHQQSRQRRQDLHRKRFVAVTRLR